MTNDKTMDYEEMVGRLVDAMFKTLRETEGTTDDVSISSALIVVLLTSIAAMAKNEEQAVEHAAQIGQHLVERAPAYFRRLNAGGFLAPWPDLKNIKGAKRDDQS